MPNYAKNQFILDFIPCLPLNLINLNGKEKYFYLIKIMRLYVGMSFLNVQAIMRWINKYNCEVRLANLIKNDPIKALNIEEEQTMVTSILILGYILKVSKLIFVIFTVTYFLAMFWHIICNIFWELTRNSMEFGDPAKVNTETFITSNNL